MDERGSMKGACEKLSALVDKTLSQSSYNRVALGALFKKFQPTRNTSSEPNCSADNDKTEPAVTDNGIKMEKIKEELPSDDEEELENES